MALPTLLLDTTGNVEVADGQRISYNCTTNLPIATALQPYIVAGTGSPAATLTAPKGTIYVRLDGGTGTMLYVNSAGSNTWQVVTSA